MDLRDVQETPIWQLYEKGQNYHRLTGIYTDTDLNFRMFEGDQWAGARLGDVEPLQENFIQPIVKYKVSVVHDNLYAIVYNSQNYENTAFRKSAERYCEMLNGYAAKVWEKDKMDFKSRTITKRAAINGEGIMYVDFDEETMLPINEIVKKCDIYYGDENNADIQSQPYILIRRRMSVLNAIEFAENEGVGDDKLQFIVGDNITHEESGDAAKVELDDRVTLVYKFYKKKGTVHFSVSTKYVDIIEDVDLGIKLYPIAHFNWGEKEGSARGVGEVKPIIPNQIEVNKILTRRALTSKLQSYPRTVVDVSKISNPSALTTVGGIIKTNGQPVEDVHKIVGTIPPAQMSPDVVELEQGLINKTSDLAGAGDSATGDVNPEESSGRAILAVQQAKRQPLGEYKEGHKNFVEDIARIWLEYVTVYSKDGINLEEKVVVDGEETIQMVNVPQSALEQLQASVKIDVTPKGVYDKFAQEQTMENLLLNGLLNPQRKAELKVWVKTLDDDSVAPKLKIEEAIEYMEEEERKIAMIQARMQMRMQNMDQFIMGDPDTQAQQIADARTQLDAETQVKAEEKTLEEQAQ